MAVIRELLARLRMLFRRDALADEIREELEFHRDARAEQYQRDGMSHVAAKREAQRRMGPLAAHQQHGYRIRGGAMADSVAQDVRYGVRVLGRQPGFSIVAVLTLALGIGASSAVVSVVDAAYLRPLPYPHPEQLVQIAVEVDGGDRRFAVPPSELDRRAWLGNQALAAIGDADPVVLASIVDGTVPERLPVRRISDGFLDVHGVQPVLGREFVAEDFIDGAQPVVLVSRAYWQQQLGGRDDAIGRRLVVDGESAEIVGVVPGRFYPETPIWRPRMALPWWTPDLRGGGGQVVGRLADGVSPDAAASELTRRLLTTPATAADAPRVVVQRLLDDAGTGALPTLQVLGGAVLFVLLLGCINVAGLLLARGATRDAELATRAAIGAGRGRLIRQMLTESLVLAVTGGAAGLLLAWLTLDLLVACLPMRMPDNVVPAVNMRVLGFAAAATLITSVLFGLAPAVRLSRIRLAATASGLRDRGRALSRRGGGILVAAEVSMAIVLLAGAGLMLRSFDRTLAVDIGFDPARFVTVEVQPVDSSKLDSFYTDLVAALRRLPGVSAVGATDTMPLMGGLQQFFATAPGGERPLQPRQVLPGYVEAVGLRLVEGRPLAPSDRSASAITGALINESAARRLFPGESAIGKPVTYGGAPPPGSEDDLPRPLVVGVVGDVRQNGPLSRAPDEIYVPFSAGPLANTGLTVVVRPTERDPVTPDMIRDVARSIGPRVAVGAIRSGREWYGERVTTPRQRTVLLSLLAGLGLLLALVGIFGMSAYAVARRTREIGLRMAFGARPDQVVRRVIADAAWPIAIGTILGLGLAAMSTRVIESFLFETTPTDPLTFAAVATVLATTGLIAAWIPARRAARVDPVAALRAE